MSKGSKVFWVFLSIVFAAASIVVGSLYDAKRKNNLSTSIEQKVTSTSKTKQSKKETSNPSEETKDSVSQTEESTQESVETDNIDQTEQGTVAQQFIDVIIVDGQVRSDFTLDDYYAAETAVNALSEGSEKTALLAKIEQIQTALTNMGVSY